MQLIVSELISLDGVVQAPVIPTRTPTAGHPHVCRLRTLTADDLTWSTSRS